MMRNDLTHWPLVLTVAIGQSSLREHEAFLAAWTSWLDRGEPFAVLRTFASQDALVHPDGGARMAKQWMQDNGERIRQTVAALVSVVPATEYERMRKMNVEKLFGVPGAVFSSSSEALAWLDAGVFQRRGWSIDHGAVEAALSSLLAA